MKIVHELEKYVGRRYKRLKDMCKNCFIFVVTKNINYGDLQNLQTSSK